LVVERTDFISVPVTDMERAVRFMLHRRYAPRA
jgi:hypothetical protein